MKETDSSGRTSDQDDADSCALDPNAVACDACGAAMKPMGHCKYWCLRCGFLRTCNDTM
ncbi:MAG: hypothetical protein ACREQR_07690 [Candidatus Binataceae bacterium]